MDKIQIEHNSEIEEKNSVSNEDLKEELSHLSKKVDKLSNQLKLIEQKLNLITGIQKSQGGNDVEVEEQNELDEDYLTPSDLIFENDAIRNTGMKLISLRIATASEIANITKKDRAVESLYLNDLWSRNKVRKLRIGRKIYFYIGKPSEIKPFKNSIIKSEWRNVLLSIIRELSNFETNKTLNFHKIVNNYLEYTKTDEMTNKNEVTESQKQVEKTVLEILQDIEKTANLVKITDQKIEFIIKNWMELGF